MIKNHKDTRVAQILASVARVDAPKHFSHLCARNGNRSFQLDGLPVTKGLLLGKSCRPVKEMQDHLQRCFAARNFEIGV